MDRTADIVLKSETLPGRAPKLEAVTRALEVWGEALRTAAEIAEPGTIDPIRPPLPATGAWHVPGTYLARNWHVTGT
jgi:hypothetical protein